MAGPLKISLWGGDERQLGLATVHVWADLG